MSALTAWVRSLDNRMNPIVVKELRQISRGKFLIVILIGFLFTQLTVTGFFSVFSRGSSSLGPDLFQTLLAFLTGTCALLIPAYAGFRIANERAGENMDLLFSTTLKPASIVWGKTLSAGILAAMIYSVCMPFIYMTYLLRGIDLLTALMSLVMSFGYVTLAAQIGILIGCMPASRVMKGIVGLVGLVGVFVFAFQFQAFPMSGAGVAARFGILLIWALIAGLCFLLSTAFISPPSANRALIPRLYVTGVWAISFLIVLVWSRIAVEIGPILMWYIIFGGFFSWAMIVSVSERDFLGPRVRRQIPRSGLRRLFAFLFYSGSAGGFLWASIGVLSTFLFGWIGLTSPPQLMDAEDFLDGASILSFACINLWIASAGAVLIHRKFLKKRVSNGYTWLIALGVYMVSNITWATMLIGSGVNFHAPIWAVLLFGISVSNDNPPTAAIGIAALIMVCFCIPWIKRQFSAFTPPLADAPS
ncbi:MAG: hypothetical protein OXT69_04375 [Candidatus Poribacteria bacterium]|nr:hypothetical protein [Candidatus Poribacteria bacterium]